MTNFERIKNAETITDMAKIINELPEFGWLDECVVDCLYNGECSKNCILEYLEREVEE